MTIWRFPEIGVPLNHPVWLDFFFYKPSSYGGTSILGKPPHLIVELCQRPAKASLFEAFPQSRHDSFHRSGLNSNGSSRSQCGGHFGAFWVLKKQKLCHRHYTYWRASALCRNRDLSKSWSKSVLSGMLGVLWSCSVVASCCNVFRFPVGPSSTAAVAMFALYVGSWLRGVAGHCTAQHG